MKANSIEWTERKKWKEVQPNSEASMKMVEISFCWEMNRTKNGEIFRGKENIAFFNLWSLPDICQAVPTQKIKQN